MAVDPGEAHDNELELNSIERYVKASPRFVLEEHGHCEVPAGCGGVVLRWRDPRTAVPVRLQMRVIDVNGYEARVDGVRPASSRPLLAPGLRVLVIHATLDRPGRALVLFDAHADVAGEPRLASTGTGGTWRWTADEPPVEAMADPRYDDAAWAPMVAGSLGAGHEDDYAIRRLLRTGATPLSTSSPADEVWIRTTFRVPSEGGG